MTLLYSQTCTDDTCKWMINIGVENLAQTWKDCQCLYQTCWPFSTICVKSVMIHFELVFDNNQICITVTDLRKWTGRVNPSNQIIQLMWYLKVLEMKEFQLGKIKLLKQGIKSKIEKYAVKPSGCYLKTIFRFFFKVNWHLKLNALTFPFFVCKMSKIKGNTLKYISRSPRNW